MKENELKCNLKKCKFFKLNVEYLGYIIDKNGIRSSRKRVEAMADFPNPKNLNDVQALNGMITRYAKFIPNLSTLMSPIFGLLKKEQKFVWTAECSVALKEIKKEILFNQSLVHFHPNLPIKLSCDTSKVGIGAVLLHVFPNGHCNVT